MVCLHYYIVPLHQSKVKTFQCFFFWYLSTYEDVISPFLPTFFSILCAFCMSGKGKLLLCCLPGDKGVFIGICVIGAYFYEQTTDKRDPTYIPIP
jgi:hypothetical protein